MAQMKLTDANSAHLLQEIQKSSSLEANQSIKLTDIPTVIAALSNVAVVQQVTIRRINSMPQEDLKDFPYFRIPLVMELEGDYLRMGEFLGGLPKKIPWFFSLDTIQMAATAQFDGKLTAKIRVSFYSRK